MHENEWNKEKINKANTIKCIYEKDLISTKSIWYYNADPKEECTKPPSFFGDKKAALLNKKVCPFNETNSL